MKDEIPVMRNHEKKRKKKRILFKNDIRKDSHVMKLHLWEKFLKEYCLFSWDYFLGQIGSFIKLFFIASSPSSFRRWLYWGGLATLGQTLWSRRYLPYFIFNVYNITRESVLISKLNHHNCKILSPPLLDNSTKV